MAEELDSKLSSPDSALDYPILVARSHDPFGQHQESTASG